MADPKVSSATANFGDIFIEFLTLSSEEPSPPLKELARQKTSDGQITLGEFRAFGCSDDIFYQVTRHTKDKHSRPIPRPLTVFDVADAVKKLKCKLGTYPALALCEKEKVIVEKVREVPVIVERVREVGRECERSHFYDNGLSL